MPSVNPFDSIVNKSMSFWKICGCSVAIVKEGQVLHCKGYGTKSLDPKKMHNNVNAHTLFPIASLTKPFTAVLAGILVDKQAVQWEDPIAKHYPLFKLSNEYAYEHLTLHDCLCMHSGLQGPEISRELEGKPAASRKQLLELLPTFPFLNGFRGLFGYQNLHYVLAGKLLETVYGSSWEKMVAKEIFSPLKMDRSCASGQKFQHDFNHALPYQVVLGQIKPAGYESLENIAPGAGVYSTAEDMAKFLQAISLNTRSNEPLLKVGTCKKAMQPQCLAAAEGFFGQASERQKEQLFPDAQFFTYGYGWFIHDYRGMLICHAPGITDGYAAVMLYVPAMDLGIVVLANVESTQFVHSLAYQILDKFFHVQTDWDALYLQRTK